MVPQASILFPSTAVTSVSSLALQLIDSAVANTSLVRRSTGSQDVQELLPPCVLDLVSFSWHSVLPAETHFLSAMFCLWRDRRSEKRNALIRRATLDIHSLYEEKEGNGGKVLMS
jgi:hypothetical protein